MRWLSVLAAAVIACGAGKVMAEPSAPAKPSEMVAAWKDAAASSDIDAYFEPPVLGVASLSPSGRRLALARRQDKTQDVVVYDHQTRESRSVYAVKGDNLRIEWVRWKDEDRVLIGVARGFAANLSGLSLALDYGRFIVAVDRSGQHPKVMFRDDPDTAKQTTTESALLDVLKSDPDHILAIAPIKGGPLAIWKANLRTGAATIVEKGDDTTFLWQVDKDANIVVRYRARGRSLAIEGRGPGEQSWTEIIRLRKKDFKEAPDFEVVGPGPKPGTLYVFVAPKTPQEGETRRLRLYDFGAKTLSDPVWPDLKYEPASILTRTADQSLLGVCYLVDVTMCDFTDKELSAIYRGLVKFFENRRNIGLLDVSDDGRWLLLDVNGPTEPGAYYIYDVANKRVEALGSRYPNLPEARLAQVEPYAYTARDGVAIPAYLTRPAGSAAGPAPLVVMPHGGPEVRDSIVFDVYAQYLASRGYLVFQPNFRGSGGYGLSYAAAGRRQWGERMQDDVTDGVKSLVAKGLADPARICIVGASYGGYAALQAGATTPDLYRCVVSIAGVSDLNAFMRWQRKESGGADEPRYLHWVKLIGDPATDKERLSRASPITYAATYPLPVLMFHGDLDDSVPLEQSKKMDAALRKAGRKSRLVVLEGAAHNGWKDEHEKSTLKEIAAFLDDHIGPRAASPDQAKAAAGR